MSFVSGRWVRIEFVYENRLSLMLKDVYGKAIFLYKTSSLEHIMLLVLPQRLILPNIIHKDSQGVFLRFQSMGQGRKKK